MRNNRKAIKLASELLGYCFGVGIHHMQMDIDSREDQLTVTVSGTTTKDIQNQIEDLRVQLNTPKETQVEEYYWELMGETVHADELTLVGMIIDKAEVNYHDKHLEIRILKKY